MKWIWLIALCLVGCTAPQSAPAPKAAPKLAGPPMPVAPKISRKPLVAEAMTATAAVVPTPPVTQPVLVLPGNGNVVEVTQDGTNWNLIVEKASPKLYVPGTNFFRLDASTDLKTWSTVGYFTNFVNGIYLVDDDGQSLAARFFKVVPQ